MRMSDDTRVVIAILCGAILSIFLFIFVFIKGRTRGNSVKERAIKDGTITKAKAVKNTHRRHTGPDGRYRSETVVYEYAVAACTYRKKLTFYNIGVFVGYPESVDIYYNRKNPRKAYSSAELE